LRSLQLQANSNGTSINGTSISEFKHDCFGRRQLLAWIWHQRKTRPNDVGSADSEDVCRLGNPVDVENDPPNQVHPPNEETRGHINARSRSHFTVFRFQQDDFMSTDTWEDPNRAHGACVAKAVR
jgi:hypothetical protein